MRLKVVGQSMIDENINDGDIIIVKHQATANNGEKVVALLDQSDVTLKTFFAGAWPDPSSAREQKDGADNRPPREHGLRHPRRRAGCHQKLRIGRIRLSRPILLFSHPFPCSFSFPLLRLVYPSHNVIECSASHIPFALYGKIPNSASVLSTISPVLISITSTKRSLSPSTMGRVFTS